MLLYYNILCYRSQSDVTSLPLIANPLMLLALRKEMEMLTMIMMMMLTTTMMMMLMMMRMVKCTIVSWAILVQIPSRANFRGSTSRTNHLKLFTNFLKNKKQKLPLVKNKT